MDMHGLVDKYSSTIKEKLKNIFYSNSYDGMISKKDVNEISETIKVHNEDFMIELLPFARTFSVCPISKFNVGSIVKGGSGNLYFGANLEFPGESLNYTLHAEQSAIMNAWNHDEETIAVTLTSYIPCCLCRQFILELNEVEKTMIMLPDKCIYKIHDLVPHPFGPKDLGVTSALMKRKTNNLLTTPAISGDNLIANAFNSANTSYAPYSKVYAGVALISDKDRIVTGSYAENAAFNVSMNPMMAALSNYRLFGLSFESIKRAVIVENTGIISHVPSSQNLLKAVNSSVELEIVKID